MSEQLLGLITGVLFGALLQQGRVLRYEKQVGAMLLKDMTILKFMLSAIVVGMVGINLLVGLGVIELSVKAASLGANLIGGLLFGAGWAVMGYCPGRWHALFAIAGMLVGAALFAQAWPTMEATVVTWGNLGKITLPGVLGVSPWLVIPVLVIAFLALFRLFERKGL